MFGTSIYSHRLMSFLDTVQRSNTPVAKGVSQEALKVFSIEDGPMPNSASDGFADNSLGQTSFWRQYITLVKRGYILAIRDPALYYLQLFLLLLFGFLVGAAFLRLKYVIDSTIINIPAAITWIVFMMAYLQVFKVKGMSSSKLIIFLRFP